MISVRVRQDVSVNGWFLMVRCHDSSTDLFREAKKNHAMIPHHQGDHTSSEITECMARHQWRVNDRTLHSTIHIRTITQPGQFYGSSAGGVGTNKMCYERASAVALGITLGSTRCDLMSHLSGMLLSMQMQVNRSGEQSVIALIPRMLIPHTSIPKSVPYDDSVPDYDPWIEETK